MGARRVTIIFFMLVAASLALMLVLASGCGGDTDSSTTTAFVCDKNAPSIIPKPTGRPMLVEFYRDT